MATKAKYAVGDKVSFKGYGDDVPEDEQLLEAGEVYEVSEVNAKEGTLAVTINNPEYNPKKKETDENSKTVLVDVFFEEVELAAEETEEEEAAEEEAPPARTSRTKPAAEAKGKATAKATEKAAPAAKGKVDAKAKAKAAPAAKGKAAAKPAKKEEEVEEVDEAAALPELESEDAEIVELVNGTDDLVALAEELVEDQAALDYRLGGVLYHTRLSGAYKELDKTYGEKGGWQRFLEDKLPNLGYRKAMHLIDIYYKFNLNGIDGAKVQELGWTKCSKVAAVMTGENAEELIELAGDSSVSELSDAIKESYVEKGGEKGEKRRKVMFKFRLWEDQAAGVEEVLKATQESMGHKDISDTFEHIVMEWAAEHGIDLPKKASTKASAKAEAPAVKAGAKARARA